MYVWQVTGGQVGQPKLTMSASVEAETEAEALELFGQRNPGFMYTRLKRVRKLIQTYEELADWLKENGVTPEQAQGAVQCMVINVRPENTKPNLCPSCKADLNRVGHDMVDNAYYCKRCKHLLQVG